MEKQPQFIREFSKEESSEERQQANQEIRRKRTEHFAEKRAQTERQAELQRTTSEREPALAEKLATVKKLEREIADLSVSRLGRILNGFKLGKLRADVAIGQKSYEDLKQQQDREKDEVQALTTNFESKDTPPALQEAKVMLAKFYRSQKQKWATSEYTQDDLTKYFSEEYLARLSLDDYALLLQRFPREMVAHVTRQGIRDHIGMVYHMGGKGEYADGFMKMVEDGRLRSPLGVYLVEGEKEQAIARFLQLETFESKDEALEHLAALTDARQGNPGTYADRMAVHFATEEVADCYYGSETGNEIFIAYPSAHIASQYYFNGQLNENGGGYWNDQWVWANEERGMDLNAGLVFIPETAQVDRKTGSRYELDENNNPIKNTDYQAAYKRVVDSADFHDFADQAKRITGKFNIHTNEARLLPEDRELSQRLEPFRQRLEQEFGIIDRRLQFAILGYHNLSSIDRRKTNLEAGQPESIGSIESEIDGALQSEGILYRESKDTINSKEFWEAYFAEHPDKRPSKIVYYQGADPTQALWRWRKEQGINKKAGNKDIGFSEKQVERSAPRATVGLDRFKTLAEKVIEDHFAQRKATSG